MKTPEQKAKDKQKAEKLKIREMARKTKKQFSRSKLIKEADRVFSLYIRGRDSWKPCCTCGRSWEENFQCWHFQTRGNKRTRWLANNSHGQCPWCNNWWKGEQYLHSLYVDKQYGNWTAQMLKEEALKIDKVTDSEILETIQHYYKLCFELGIDYKPKKQFNQTEYET